MGWLMRWDQGCRHEPGVWEPQQHGNGAGVLHDYAITRCTRCTRPLVAFAPGFPLDACTPTRRHVAWHYLDKEGEHAANVHVVSWQQVSR